MFDATPGTEQLIVFVSLHPLDDVGGSISAGQIVSDAWQEYVVPYISRSKGVAKDISYVPDEPQPAESAPSNQVSCPIETVIVCCSRQEVPELDRIASGDVVDSKQIEQTLHALSA